MLIREALVTEAEVLSELAFRSKAYWGYSDEFMDACRDELRVSETELLNLEPGFSVAQINDVVAGFCALAESTTTEFELDALFVAPDFIGKGVGRALIERAKSQAREQGALSLRIQSDPHASSFYIAAGGVKIGESASGSIAGRYLPVFRIQLD